MQSLRRSIREHNRDIIRLNNFFNDMLLIFGVIALLALISVVTML